MSTSSNEPSTAQDKKVDVTFIVRDGRHIFFDEEGGYTTNALREKGVSCSVFERLNLPDGFQLSDIHALSDMTRLLVVDCLIESSQDISEGEGLSTGLKFAEEVRKVHPDLPIWLLDPIDAEDGLGIKKRAQANGIEEVFLFDAVPSVFLEKVEAVLRKTK